MSRVSLDPPTVRRYGERMRRRCGWTCVVAGLALGLWVARVDAGQAVPNASPGSPPPTEEACATACQVLIDRCTGTFGPAMGDMRPYCTRAVIRRCKATGLKSCEVVADEPR